LDNIRTLIEEVYHTKYNSKIVLIRLAEFFHGRDGILKAHLLSLLSFLVLYVLPDQIIVLIARLCFGIFAIVIIPGAVIAARYLAPDLRSVATSLTMGVFIFCLVCQFQLLLKLVIGFQIPIVISVVIAEILIIITFLILSPREVYAEKFWITSLGFTVDARLNKVFLLALLFRFLLLLLVPNSFSPDAALLADYGHSILDGSYVSSIQNDISVIQLWNGSQYLIHQGFAYVLTLSFLLTPVEGVGTFVILPLIGSALIFPVYLITNRIFGQKAAYLVSVLMMIDPLLIFHSAVGYGSEIVSMLFLAYGFIFILRRNDSTSALLFIAGLMIGLIDVIWYTNFYILCIILPVIVYLYDGKSWSEAAKIGVLMGLVIVSKLFFRNIALFYSLWLALFVIIGFQRLLKSDSMIARKISMFLGIFIVLVLWRLPLQLVAADSISSISTDTPLIAAIFAPIELNLILSFVFFFLFHISFGIFGLLVYSFLKGERRSETVSIFIVGLLIAIGTLKVFSLIPGSLQLQYIYSDSRFFLFLTVCAFIASGSYFSNLDLNGCSFELWRKDWEKICHNKKPVYVFAVIIIFFLPGFMVYPVGTILVDVRSRYNRYGWNNLEDVVATIGDSESVFLVDRAREFAWLTGRKSAVMELSQINLDLFNASNQLITLSSRFNTSYFLMDEYTIAHWGVFEYLIDNPLAIGNAMIIDLSRAIEPQFSNITDSMRTLKLVGQSQTDDFGSFGRIFQFTNNSFNHLRNENLLESGWGASNRGSISNSSGEIRLTIGSGASYTNTLRTNGYDLNLNIDSGYLIFTFEYAGAIVERIEIYDSNGSLISYAERFNDGLYYCPIGELKIGDIHIIINGNPGSSVIIKSISTWEVS
jgi:hypothetical protein